jgi:peptidoglycan/LPS O-acetylase OafA/YrhL
LEKEIREITGMRGLAVLAVLGYHFLTLGPFHGLDQIYVQLVLAGWSGVDFFFVLSAFLLTRLYYDHLILKRHYVRRIFRTFPLYWVSLPIFAVLIAYPLQIQDLILGQNFLQLGGSCPLSCTGTPYWTLTIEEIFYALIPLWFWIWKRWDHRILVLGFTGISLAYRAMIVYTPLAGSVPNAIMLDRQFPSFLVCYAIGTWLALDKPRPVKKSWAVMLLILVAWIYGADSGAVLADLSFAVAWGLIMLAFTQGSRVLSRGPIYLIGQWSYAIYVLQWPFLLVYGVFLGTALTFLIAGIAHYTIEKPLVGLGRRLTKGTLRDPRRSDPSVSGPLGNP